MGRILDTFPDPAADAPGSGTLVLAGGCFWCTEGVFRQMPGVLNVISGYAGGDKSSASYRLVCEGDTGHAEVIAVEYDPKRVSIGQILKTFFWLAHDPTQVNRQGNDVGTQYRSAIFYADDEQRDIAARYIAQLDAAHVFDAPIATTLEPLKAFYRAEDYHQDYAALNPSQGYIMAVAEPKISAARKVFNK
jgi:peptide-methionine (S)-S-oxide reductase